MTATAAPPSTDSSDIDGQLRTGYKGPKPEDLDGQLRLADGLSKAELVIPAAYRGKPGDLLALIQQAIALDIPVMTAITNLFFEPDGSGGMSAQLMGALLRRGGADWDITIDPGRSCVMSFVFADGRTGGRVQYTMADARAAEIAGTDNWVRFPDDNLVARCLARGARWLAQDMLQGWGYLPGERRDDPGAGYVDPEVSEEVTAFLSSVTDQTSAADLRALMKTAKSKRVGLSGEAAGGGLTVDEWLQARWRVAAAREAGRTHEAAFDATHPAVADQSTGQGPARAAAEPAEVSPTLADGPPGAAVLDAPAGEGNLPCGCEAFKVITAGGVHDAEVCTGE